MWMLVKLILFLVLLLTLSLTLIRLGRSRLCTAENGKRSVRCLSVASFGHFPFFASHKRALPQGASLRSPFFEYFLWRSKESISAAGPRPGLCPRRAIVLIKAHVCNERHWAPACAGATKIESPFILRTPSPTQPPP